MNDGENKANDVKPKNATISQPVKILTGALIVVAAATAVAFFLLFTARGDIDDLQTKQEGIESSTESSSSQATIDIEGLRTRLKKVEEQINVEKSETEKAKKDEFDPDKPFAEGDVSVTSMLKTIDLNAETANKNFDTIETEVSRLKGLLDEEKQVAGD